MCIIYNDLLIYNDLIFLMDDYLSLLMFGLLHFMYHGLYISNVMDGCLCLCDFIYLTVVDVDGMWMISVVICMINVVDRCLM